MSWSRWSLLVCLILLSVALALVLSVPPRIARAATTYTVQSAADDGTAIAANCPGVNCRLRDALAAAASGDTITFNGDYTITLTSELLISNSLTIDGSGHNITVSGNHATRVFSLTGGTITLNQLTIADGTFDGGLSGDSGGGIHVNGSTLYLTNSTVSGNTTGWPGGGGMEVSSGTANVINSSFIGNSTSAYGGGIDVGSYGTLNVTNSTFFSNSAASPGGGLSIAGTANILNSTITGNSSGWTGGGGGINQEGGTITIRNSIVADNPTGYNCYYHSFGPLNGSNNLTNDNTCATVAGFTNSSTIRLGMLGDYGGAVPTIPLLPGSAALNAAGSNCPATDARNQSRTTPCDSGAFESQGFTLTKTGGDNQSATIYTAFAQPLGLTVTANNPAEPVDGGQVTFTAPASGASTNPATSTATVSGGAISKSVTANDTAGAYTVVANVGGGTTLNFALNNLPCVTSGVVTNANDSGAGSLRTAVADACSGGTITFDNDYTITLTSGEISRNRNLTIDGTGRAVTLSGNHTSRVLNISGGTVTLKQLTIANGLSVTGGGIYVGGGTLTVTNCTFSGNAGGTNSRGGGIYTSSSTTLNVTDSTFSGNSAVLEGGALFIGGTGTISNSTFSGNSTGSAGIGGGIANYYATLTVLNSTFSGNSSKYGGGISNYYGTLTVINSTFSGNTTISASGIGYGGGLYTESGTLTVTNSTFSGNAASTSGGYGGGGGLNVFSGMATVKNSIVANSTSGGNCRGTIGGANNLANDATCGAGFTNSSIILLGTLGTSGGSTQTFPLLPRSAAIDAGNAAACPATDQRGQPRADLQCDIGAYELKYLDSPTVIRSVDSATVTTFGPALMGIQRDAGYTDPGVITVTKEAWNRQGPESIGVVWNISPTVTSGFSLTLQFCYTDAELVGFTGDVNTLKFWSNDGAGWQAVTGTPITSTVNGDHCAVMSGLDHLSRWTLASDTPTAVTLQDFTAQVNAPAMLPLLLFVVVIGGLVLLLRKRFIQH